MTKTVDSKGRLALGPRFANRTVIIDDSDPEQLIVTPAVVIPEREAWLFENEQALNLVRAGLADARARRYSKKPPDLAAAKKVADQIKD